MKARLKVLSGSAAGKELKLKEGQFVIGRSDSCHLRPRSDAVSRKHCVLFVESEGIRLRDLKSRNGTLVNGTKSEGDVALKSGDKIAVGPLEFEILMSPETAASPQQVPSPAKAAQAPKQPTDKAETKQPSSTTAKAAAQASGGKGNLGDDDIFSWLEEGDEVDREERQADPSTRQFKAEEANTETVDIAKPDGKGSDTDVGKKKKKEKKEPGKLPPVPVKASENSQEAAADALKQFFKRT